MNRYTKDPGAVTYCPELACTRPDGHDGDHGNGSLTWPRKPSVMTESSDIEKVRCPKCGTENCLIDYQIDGDLKQGMTFDCEGCQAVVTIAAIDWSPTVYCAIK